MSGIRNILQGITEILGKSSEPIAYLVDLGLIFVALIVMGGAGLLLILRFATVYDELKKIYDKKVIDMYCIFVIVSTENLYGITITTEILGKLL